MSLLRLVGQGNSMAHASRAVDVDDQATQQLLTARTSRLSSATTTRTGAGPGGFAHLPTSDAASAVSRSHGMPSSSAISIA
jgi:hypothetical protein